MSRLYLLVGTVVKARLDVASSNLLRFFAQLLHERILLE